MLALAFMPWLSLEKDIQLEPFTLLRYKKNILPELDDETLKNAIERIIGCYKKQGLSPVEESCIIKLKGKSIFCDYNEDEINIIFEYGQMIAFSGISSRSLFSTFNYINGFNFTVIIQRIKDVNNINGVALQSRRRDGSSTDYVEIDKYQELAPRHAYLRGHCQLDINLLNALILARVRLNDWIRISDSIISFNQANTDSPSVPSQMEIVLLLGALQRILKCNTGKENDLAKFFLKTFKPEEDYDILKSPRILKSRHKNRKTIRECWIRDLFLLRGDLAHGKKISQKPLAWRLDEHLILSSFIYPLILKIILSKERVYELTQDDRVQINSFEELASSDFMNPPSDQRNSDDWLWKRILSKNTLKYIIEKSLRLL